MKLHENLHVAAATSSPKVFFHYHLEEDIDYNVRSFYRAENNRVGTSQTSKSTYMCVCTRILIQD